MNFVLALAAAFGFGAADFLGGIASRRAAVVAVIIVSQSIGLVLALIAATILSPIPGPAPLGWGALAGLAYGMALLLLYRGLSMGKMSVVAPISAVCAIVFPVLVGLVLGEEPGQMALVGIVFAILAIALVSSKASEEEEPAGDQSPGDATDAPRSTSRAVIATAIASGVGFALFFISFSRTPPSAGLWPLVASRAVTIGAFLVAARITGQSVRIAAGTFYTVAAIGVVDVCANTCYVLSVRGEMLSLSATLASLYPASTVLLAWLVLREKIGGVQAIGLGCAVASVLLITAV
ncbi:MAG: EamA family transporter [Myxococcota bacterium]